MLTWKRLLYTAVTIVVLAFAFIVLILPGMLIDRAQNWVADELDRTLKIGAIRINPLALTVSVRDLSLSEADNLTPFVSWQELKISLSSSSLIHLAPIVDEFHLESPFVQIERLAANRFNFSDLLPPAAEAEEQAPPGEPFRFSLNNLTINNGRVELVDHNLPEEVRHVIRDLDLALPAIGNLPYMVENPVQPMFHAVVNDAPVDIAGTLKPFVAAHEMRFNLSLANIDLPFYLAYLPMELPVELRNGRLSFDLSLVYRLAEENGPELEVDGQINLATLDIWDRQGEQLFFMPLLQIDIAPSRPLEKMIHLSSLRVYNLEVELNRDRQGVINHSRLSMADNSADAPPPEPEEPGQPLQLRIDDVEIRDAVLHFRDEVPFGGFETTAREINIDLENFALAGNDPSPFTLSLETRRKERLKVGGSLLLEPFTLSLQAELTDLPVAAYQPYYHDTYAGPLGGSLAARAQLDINPDQPLLVSRAALQWRDAYMAFNETEGLGIGLVDIDNLSFNLAAMRLEVGAARYDRGQVNFSRSKDGHWSFLSRNFPILAKLTEAPAETPPPTPEPQPGPEFSYLINELTISNTSFDIRDLVPESPVRLQATDFNLRFNNLAAPDEVQSPFAVATVFNGEGKIDLQGEASLAAQTLKIESNLTGIPLTVLAPYIAEQSNIILKQGELNATLQTSLDAGNDPPQVDFGGNLGISRLHLLDGTHREDLLKWDSLQLANIRGSSQPPGVAIESITLSDYFAKFLIDEDSRLNLKEALRKGAPAEEAAAAEPAIVEEQVSDAAAGPRPEIRIETVVLQGGQIDFTDRSLLRSFHADMRDLGGRISGLNSDPETRAEVDLRGRLRQQSPLEISGTVNPLAEQLALDLKLDFHDIELSPMSPYSGTYVGYLIEKGKLNLALEYQVENEQLKASNDVFLDQFTFGDPVESDRATGLPVRLAVALLKDSNGEIHLDIPVSGSLDDPQFSVAGVVWTIIKNLLVKAATSPMALLGALFGGGDDEDFSSVSFAYGSSRLPPPEQEKLQRIATALNDRPSLNLEIKGFVDPENDPEGYRHEQLRQQIRQAKFATLQAEGQLPDGMTPEAIEIGDEEYPELLWGVYQDADFPKPRNFFGMTKKIPPEEQEKLIYANTEVGPEQLAKLAQARSQAVLNFLVIEQQLARERVFLSTSDIEATPQRDDATRSRVEFDVSVD